VQDRYGNSITVQNVLAQLPAAGARADEPRPPAILLVAHYDSVSRGPGAGDDTAAVGALLEAMRALRATPGLKSDVQLLITDIVMPGMRGTEAAQRIAAAIPGVKVLYMSGYTDNAMFHQKLLETGIIFIQKPFSLNALEEKVRQTLETKARAAAAK